MNENEIKDLANFLKNSCDDTPDESCVGCDCDECAAKALINAGYRKVADDEIVIKKSEYDILLKDYTTIYGNAYQWGLKVGEEKTAIEILQELKDRQTFMLADEVFGRETVITRKINELAEKYGIELE